LIFCCNGLHAQLRDYYADAEKCYYESRYPDAIKISLEGLTQKGLTEEAAVELYSILGNSYARLGAFDKAADYMKRCYDYDKAHSEPAGLTSSLISLASLYVSVGEAELAEKYALEAISNEEANERRPDKLAMAYGKACDVYHGMGRDSVALRYADMAVAISGEVDNPVHQAIRMSQRAYPLQALGMHSEAMSDLLSAEEIFREQNASQSLAIVCYQLSQEYKLAKRAPLERQYLKEAMDLAQEVNDKPLLQKITASMAESLRDSDPRQAYMCLQEASRMQEEINAERSANALELFNIEYETAELEHTVALQEQAIQRHHRDRIMLGLIILFLAILTAVLFYFYKKLGRSEKSLRQSNEQKDFLLKVISHDIHSPAVAQLRGLQILRSNASSLSGERLRDVALQLERQAGAEVELIENALRWSRSQNQSGPGEMVRFNLVETVSEVLGQYEDTARIKDIDLVLDAPKGIVVNSNRSNLMFALRNLISNAIKFSYAGNEVEISVAAKAYGADVSVTDHGMGIPADKLGSLFSAGDVFRRQGTEGEPSNGLGLAVTKSLLESCGSGLELSSVEGEGSTFIMQIHSADDNS